MSDIKSGLTRRDLLSSATAVGLGITAGAAGATAAPGRGMVVGAATRIITPDPLLPVSGGMGPTRPATRKISELTARAIYLQNGNVPIAILALDLLGFPAVLANRVRAQVPRIPASNIVIGSTHTHSAPDCYAFPDGTGGHTGDLDYMDKVCVHAAEAINEAIDKAQPCSLRIATGEALGRIAYNYYAPDLYDRRMSVIQAIGTDSRPIATLVNYAIHPEVIGNEQGICCPDLCGPLYDRVQSQGGGTCVFMNSAQGGMITADNRILNMPKDPVRAYWDDAREWSECVRIGHLMADEALRLVASAPVQQNPTLFCRSSMARIPVDSPEMWAVVTMSPLKYPHADDKSIQTRINILNIGDAQVLTCPGEALPNIGFYAKRKMNGNHNLFFGLTNDAFGYILTKVDFHSFARYDYVSRTSLGEMTGELLIEKWLELIRTSPKPS